MQSANDPALVAVDRCSSAIDCGDNYRCRLQLTTVFPSVKIPFEGAFPGRW